VEVTEEHGGAFTSLGGSGFGRSTKSSFQRAYSRSYTSPFWTMVYRRCFCFVAAVLDAPQTTISEAQSELPRRTLR
jgi:hypothetical protein